MAYVEFRSAAVGAAESIEPDSARTEARELGPDEWAVVEIARNDGLWSLNPDGLLQRWSRRLFGIEPPRPFANERLEALRRFAVVAWKRGTVGADRICGLVEAGFSKSAASQVLEYILRRRRIDSMPRGLA